jgi:hypothetical protein
MSAECGGRGRAWQKHSRASVAHTGRSHFLQSSRCQDFLASLGICASHGFGMDVSGSTLVMRGVFRAESLLLFFPHRFFGGADVPRVGACVPTSHSHPPGFHSHAAGFHPCVATVHSCGATIHPCVAMVHRRVAASHSCVVTVHPCVARVATGVEMVKIDHFGVKTLHFAMNRPV